MKKLKNKIVLPLLFSIICGTVCGKLIYKIYDDNAQMVLNSQKIYLIQSGEYDSYNNMRSSTIGIDYAYYTDEGKYKTIIGITTSENNIDKIKQLYNIDTITNEYYLSDDDLSSSIIKYDEELENENNKDNINNIVQNMLKTYNENENIKLVKIS